MSNSKHCEEVTYTKPSTGEVTDRVIIPISQPTPNVKAIDVTDLNQNERAEMVEIFNEYQDYVDTCIKRIFTFEDFVSQTTGRDMDVKWRTFNVNGLESAD